MKSADKSHYISYKESKNIAKENAAAIRALTRQRAAYTEADYLTEMKDPANIVEFDDLHTFFFTDNGVVKAVNGVTFEIPRGATVGVVGESGCGKSVTSLSLMQLVQAPQGQITGGSIRFAGTARKAVGTEPLTRTVTDEDGTVREEPVLNRRGKPVMIAGTVRVGDSAFDGVTGLTEVTAPYTLQSIGSYAFYNSSVKRYVFEAVEAPVLEATYVSPESVAGNAELYRLFGTASVQQVGSRIFYANFYDYVAKVVEEKALHDAGHTSYVAPDFGLTIVRPENGTGYDSIIWNGFFTTTELSPYAAQRVTRQAIDLIDELPAVADVRAILETGSADEQIAAVRSLSETTVQPARSMYNLITTDAQRAFVTNYQTLLDVEDAVRTVKSELGIAAQLTELSLRTRPTKLQYTAGETFDPTGMVVVAVYDDLSEVTVTDYTLDKSTLAVGDTEVVISYGGASTVVYVTVSAAENTDPTDPSDPGDAEKGCGCGGNIAAASIPAAVILLALAFALVRRRPDKRNG